ncbi:MAG: S4 domain-containing protein YaaA [Ruoffia tabacinasalis]|jgi:S4 domain protein YaaA|uniref:S4 domain-containing protein YaaA n=2 Tax=Ruoffia TaxID=2862144 RepID=A0A839A3W1_9LACT|nr:MULTISPECIES: S4 domain-containing protein YaaA [Ruoffia]HBY90062.1 S4 domain-containing protein YaaA [Aerococcaceae bacterium]MBA5728642.1 S4 domain-containing protein YaaA [Ruoffia halotolerans]MBG9977948.1 S4 domain-containing protein YaaA [Ruoffia tabacinasalis]TLQ49054.1 S4 domain-containing protein YaaA [Ruoffia tabacinasalis]HJG47533.1 S4 domain-containing protein YaaA [Ruoffia tabacinasalis]
MDERVIEITTEYVTLGQVLKITDIIQSGGMAKWYLSEYFVYVNDEEEQRRGRKLREGDVIEFPHEEVKVFIKNRD